MKNWYFWTVVFKKTLERPLDCKEIKPVDPKGNQSWIFIGRTDAEGEIPIFLPPDGKNWLIGKDHDAGKDWSQEEKGTTEDEMIGWHHWLDEHEFEETPRVGDGQGGLESCSPWGHIELDATEWLNWTFNAEDIGWIPGLGTKSPHGYILSHVWFSAISCPPVSSVHEILQSWILECIAMPFSRGSSWPRDQTQVSCISCISRWLLYSWAIWEAQDPTCPGATNWQTTEPVQPKIKVDKYIF